MYVLYMLNGQLAGQRRLIAIALPFCFNLYFVLFCCYSIIDCNILEQKLLRLRRCNVVSVRSYQMPQIYKPISNEQMKHDHVCVCVLMIQWKSKFTWNSINVENHIRVIASIYCNGSDFIWLFIVNQLFK